MFGAAAWGLRRLGVAETLPAALAVVEERPAALFAPAPAEAAVDDQLAQLIQFLGRVRHRPADAVLRQLVARTSPPGNQAAVTGPGTPIRFAVISGADHATVLVPPSAPFAGSETFTGGGFVAAADLDRDGLAEVAITPDQGGGPRVTIFSLVGGDAPAVRANFFGIDAPAPRGCTS